MIHSQHGIPPIPKHTCTAILAGFLAAVAATPATLAAVPASINYQGKLYTNGLPFNGQITVSVGIYSNETGGTATYTESIGAVAVTNGLYSFTYGADTTNFYSALDAPDIWLEVVVDGAPLLPRQVLHSVPYALRARSAAAAASMAGYEARNVGQGYTAEEDGWVLFIELSNNDQFNKRFYDVTVSHPQYLPAGVRMGSVTLEDQERASICVPVPKGYTWWTSRSAGSFGSVYWVPVR